MAKYVSVASRICLKGIWVYQSIISPWLKPSCRYQPSCSEYTRQALVRFGCIRGIFLGMMRLLRCHPWGGSGYDPVPDLKYEKRKS